MNARKLLLSTPLIAALCGASGCVVLSSKNTQSLDSGSVVYHLPKGLVRAMLVAKRDINQRIDTTTYRLACDGEPVMEADPRHRYQLSHHKNWLSDDALSVSLGANGLLGKISVTTEDKSPQFVVKLAELAKEVGKGFTLLSAQSGEEELLNTLFDPTDVADVRRVNAELSKLTGGTDYTIAEPKLALAPTVPKNISEGVVYRPVAPYTFHVTSGPLVMPVTVLIPNHSDFQVFPITRAAFVKKVHTLTFNNGVLTDFSLTLPSQTLGFVEIPIEIAKAVTSIPAEMLSVKVSQVNSEKSLLEAEKARLDLQRALDEARKKK